MGVNNWSSFYIFQNRVVETLHYMNIYQMFMKYCKDKRRNIRILTTVSNAICESPSELR